MATLDYTSIASQITRTSSGVYTLNAASYVLFLSALQTISHGFDWLASGEALTTAQRDTIENWVSNAYVDLLTEHECEGSDVEVDYFEEVEDQNTQGDSTSAGITVVNFNTTHPDNAGNVVLTETQYMTPVAGTYLVSATVASHSQGRGNVVLYNDDDNVIAIQGENQANGVPRTLTGFVVVETGNWFYIATDNAESGNQGYAMNFSGMDEKYASCRWVKIA